jgi:hypothetical protein
MDNEKSNEIMGSQISTYITMYIKFKMLKAVYIVKILNFMYILM